MFPFFSPSSDTRMCAELKTVTAHFLHLLHFQLYDLRCFSLLKCVAKVDSKPWQANLVAVHQFQSAITMRHTALKAVPFPLPTGLRLRTTKTRDKNKQILPFFPACLRCWCFRQRSTAAFPLVDADACGLCCRVLFQHNVPCAVCVQYSLRFVLSYKSDRHCSTQLRI